jgi:uncharacterized protein (DUF1330 family)
MPHLLVIAMNVTDPDRYAKYRAGMAPVLARHSGSFGYDFTIAATHQSPAPHPVTRVFTMQFPSRAARDAFFSDPDYLKVRAEHFTPSVDGFTLIAEHETA